ncbi:MAG: hypothetical protein HY548_08245, partial [Elusimicrobia bacterium]|nr:hypothetical protein [Elusimicrobiota bacterium]
CMVVDPPASNLEGGGVTLDVKPSAQVEFIKKNFPLFKRIGVLYSSHRNKEVIKELKEIKQRGGADLVFAEVTAIEQVDKILTDLSTKADCLLMLSDPTIYTPQTASQIIMRTLELNFPIIAASPAYVKAGALAGIYADTEDNGCQASEVVGRVLAGEKADAISLHWPKKTKTAVNLVVAERLRVQVNSSTIESAEQVIK